MGDIKHLNAAAGFTMVELITVIVILSVLAASVAVRLVRFNSESHRAVVFATAGAFISAASLAQHACITRNYFGRDNMPGYGNDDVDFSPTCFPASTNNANGPVNNNRCVQIWNAILARAPTINAGNGPNSDFRGQGSGTTCTYTYKKDPSAVRLFTYSTQTGTVAITNP
jgi:hypothetical protein